MSPRNRILLADDNETDVETWKAYLSELGCETKAVTDSADTLDCVGQWQPDLILLNPVMPKVNGFDICRQIKDNPETSNTVILMVTELRELSDVERAVEAGTDDFLSKPVIKSELLKRVVNMLRLGRIRRRPT